ncbi:MAG: transcription termination/antitermination protein NusA [Verrucomicrobiales bacterium]|nr:transcription termination/antitermination protein NusA [Verrucomicrobiales bacterium]MBE86132.1 transcription termination/antitermination protein NusA [Verrucomicrobiales bacterium]|tara:strand:+ start:1332 stop:2696 length:1365 start_codon:yes stop_codon:yes gene_type:complete
MTSEIQVLFEYYEKEKGIPRDTMVEALETALLSAARKSVGPARELRVDVNPEKGDIVAVAKLIASEKVKSPYEEISMEIALKINPEAQLGDEIEVKVTPKDFGRIAAQTARQTMMQQLRIAEKAMIYDEFKDRAGDIVGGTVRRFDKSDVMVDLGKFEGTMPSRERVTTDQYSIGDRIRAYVVAVENGSRGPEIILSRSHPNFVRRLFEFEVSEIADQTVEIRGIAREPGFRTKVAVYSEDPKVDPVGACVGLRGARVKNIVRELNNEKVDIIRWSEDLTEFVTDALKPAIIRSIEIDEGQKQVRVTVDEEELSKAIGRRGQNARLTSRLLGWDVQIDKDASKTEIFEKRVIDAADEFVLKIGEDIIDSDTAIKLVKGGIVNLEFFSMVDVSDVAEILEGDNDAAEKICEAAKKIAPEANNDSASANDQLNDGNNDSNEDEKSEESEGEQESEQ